MNWKFLVSLIAVIASASLVKMVLPETSTSDAICMSFLSVILMHITEKKEK